MSDLRVPRLKSTIFLVYLAVAIVVAMPVQARSSAQDSPAPHSRSDATKHFDKALNLLKAGDADSAVDEFKAGLKIWPNDATAWFYLGEARLKLGSEDLAKTAFYKSLALESKGPNADAARARLAQIDVPKGTAVGATAADTQAIAAKPPTPSPGTSKAESGQEAPGASGPSLEDTAHWIESNLLGLHAEEKDSPRTFRISKASMNGCTLSIVTEAEGYHKYTRTQTAPLGQLSNIGPATGMIMAFATNDSIETHTVHPAPTDGSEATTPLDESVPALIIETDDEAMSARMVKALQHAVALCKAVSKPDLFK